MFFLPQRQKGAKIQEAFIASRCGGITTNSRIDFKQKSQGSLDAMFFFATRGTKVHKIFIASV